MLPVTVLSILRALTLKRVKEQLYKVLFLSPFYIAN